ncbi:MAG: hypothetical protein D6705_14505 [Deltaproteobacteria bacterium]|nr:MAG: hypothetical protein D6705_14505 [Deltaproteobacteria bacterium]
MSAVPSRSGVLESFVFAGALALSCGGRADPKTAPQAEAERAPLPPAAERHQAAFEAALPTAEDLLADMDPMAAARIGRASLEPPSFDPGRVDEILGRRDALFAELADIRIDVLEPMQAALLRAVRFALSAYSDRWRRRRPTRRSPGWIVAEFDRFVTELETRSAAGRTEGFDAALAAVPAAVAAAFDDLGGTSIPEGRAAVADLRTLARRLRRLPLDGPSATKAAHAAEAFVRAATSLKDALPPPDAAARPYDLSDLRPRGAEDTLVRLESSWGPRALEAFLADQEAVYVPAPRLLATLEATAAHLAALRVAPPGKTRARPVTPERCSALVEELAPAFARFPQVAGVDIDCRAFARTYGEPMSDAELAFRLTRDGYARAAARARQRAELPVLALVTGRIAEAVQPLAQSIALLLHAKRRGAAFLAVAEARSRVCAAMAAVYLHGRVGPPEAIEDKLSGTCPSPAAALEAAYARPHAAFAGIALASIAGGPAELAALDRYPWLPYGLIATISRPEANTSPPPVRVEPLDGASDDTTPTSSGSEAPRTSR